MRIVSASVTLLAAFGLLAGASISASACSWHKSHVTAAATPAPVEEQATVPATTVDPVVLADLDKAVVLPRAPEESLESGVK